jgi:hypothetical protein
MKIRNYWQQPRCSKNNRITGGHHPKHRVCSAACSQVLLQNQLIFYCIAIHLMWLLTIYLFILLFPLIILNQVMTESKKERRVWYDDLSTIAILSIAYAVSSSLMFVVTLRSSCGHHRFNHHVCRRHRHDCCRLQMLPGLLLLSDQVPICWRYLLQEACFEWCVSFFLLTSVCKT